MHKKILSCLFSVSLLIGFAAPTSLHAADTGETTPGRLSLLENEDVTTPRDPDDPTKELEDPDDEHVITDNKGPLSLDVIPKEFDFGQQKMSLEQIVYQGVNQKADDPENATKKQYIQVTDNRGQVSGWKVTVKQADYLATAEGHKLTGSFLTIPERTALNSLKENLNGTDFFIDEVEITTAEKDFFLPVGTDNGKAVSIANWLAKDVKLTVPNGVSVVGAYSNEIIWTLTATVTA
ncbi:WxL domain-containing protein [Enterococcus sp. LJL120]